jgi:hypothetical protein
MSLLRTCVTVLARTLARAVTTSRGRSSHADVTDGYEAWLAESFPRLHQS